MAQESVGLISVAHQAFVTIAGCGVNAASGSLALVITPSPSVADITT
ncbi:TPA: hypothetical protein JLS18_000422 [Escherichia coli]|nr:hypothetical protein [Escherichia coli]